MFYVFSTGIINIPPGESNFSNIMFSQFDIELTKLTLYIDAAVTQVQRQNTFVNLKPQGDTKWEFDSDYVPIEYIAGTPQYPYILKEKILLYQNYLNLKFQNNNAINIPVCVAFIGINKDFRKDRFNYDPTTKRNYNYQLNQATVGSAITINNGVANLPAAVIPYNGSASFLNQYEPYFEIDKLWQWLTPPLDAAVQFQLDRYSIPIMSNPTPIAQLFGTADQPFKLDSPIWMKNNERMLVTFTHNTLIPPSFPVSLNFSGNLYQEKGKVI